MEAISKEKINAWITEHFKEDAEKHLLNEEQCKAIDEINAQVAKSGKKILHTRGVYSSGDHKENGVALEHINEHIPYNLMFRWGRALFVEGFCINKGYLSEEEIAECIKKLKDHPVSFSRNTAPYQ